MTASQFPFIPLIGYFTNMCVVYATLTRRDSVFFNVIFQLLLVLLLYFVERALFLLRVPKEYMYYFVGLVPFALWLLLFKEGIKQQLFVCFALWLLTMFIISTYNFIALKIVSLSSSSVLYILSYAVIRFALIVLYVIFFRSPVKRLLEFLNQVPMVFILLPVMVFFIHLFIFNPYAVVSIWDYLARLLFEVFVLLMYYILISNLKITRKYAETETHLKNFERLLEIEKKYYFKLDEILKKQRILKHDFRHHVLVLSSLEQAGEYQAMQSLIEEFLRVREKTQVRRYCEHDLANGVIAGYVESAQEKGILVALELNIPKNIGIDEYELCVLLDIVLELAFDACDRIPADNTLFKRRNVIVKAVFKDYRFALSVEHSSLLPLAEPVGLKAITDRYLGGFYYNQKDAAAIFSVTMMGKATLSG